MRYNEAAVFRWVMIVTAAVLSVVAVTLLTRPRFGALWGLVLVIAGAAYGIRWTREWWRSSRDRPGGPDHRD